MIQFSLYFANAPAGGVPEFRVGDFKKLGEHEKALLRRAESKVKDVFRPGFEFMFRMGYDPFVPDVKTANAITKFCQGRMPTTISRYYIERCMHGNIGFHHRLYFPDKGEKNVPLLIKVLKQSGYVPKNEEEAQVRRFYENQAEKLEKELAKLDQDKPWKDALEVLTKEKQTALLERLAI